MNDGYFYYYEARPLMVTEDEGQESLVLDQTGEPYRKKSEYKPGFKLRDTDE